MHTGATSFIAIVLCSACVGGSGKGEAKSSEQPAAAAPATGAPAAAAGAVVKWNGDDKASGKGWATCNKKGECQATLEPTAGAGKEGAGLKFHGEGPDWIGAGWNWHGWYPEDAGDDISGHQSLTFAIKVEARTPAEAPDPNTVEVWLSCSCKANKDDERGSNHVKIADYEKAFNDGAWHQVTIPIADLMKDKGAKFDKTTVWEFDLGTWSGEPRNFNIYLDDIGFM